VADSTKATACTMYIMYCILYTGMYIISLYNIQSLSSQTHEYTKDTPAIAAQSQHPYET